MVFLFFCSFFLGQLDAKAQEITQPKIINDSIVGEAVFQYTMKGKDTLYNGSFEFNSTQKAKNNADVISYNYTGNYLDHQKTGEWIFSTKRLQLKQKFKEENYQVTYSTSGKEFKIIGNFKEGLADGDWQVIQQKFKSSEPSDTLYSITAKFKNAKMVDFLNVKSKQISIKGQLTDDGLLDGDWEIIHQQTNQDLVEIRTYEEGVFKAHYFKVNNQKYPIQHIGLDTSVDEEENWVDYKIRDDYFQLFQLTNFGFDEGENPNGIQDVQATTEKTNQFLKDALLSFGYYHNYEVWNSLRGNRGILFGKFKVRKFPFSAEEKMQLKQMQKQSEEMQQMLNKFFTNPQIEIGKLRYQDISKYELILDQYQNALPKLNQIIEKITLPAFEYVVREDVFAQYDLGVSFNPEKKYSFQKETFSTNYSFPSVPQKSDYSISSFAELTKQMHKSISEIDQAVTLILKDLSKQESLNEEEEAMVAKKAKLKRLFSNEAGKENYNAYHEAVSQQIIPYANQVLEDYVQLPVDEKVNEIQSALSCMDTLLDAYVNLEDLPRKLARLDDVYTRTSFNPYLMVDMSERIKERIYKAFEMHLFPAYIEELKANLNCEQLPSKLQAIENLYNRMVELSDEDTSAKEKELRRERDLDEIKRIILQ